MPFCLFSPSNFICFANATALTIFLRTSQLFADTIHNKLQGICLYTMKKLNILKNFVVNSCLVGRKRALTVTCFPGGT